MLNRMSKWPRKQGRRGPVYKLQHLHKQEDAEFQLVLYRVTPISSQQICTGDLLLSAGASSKTALVFSISFAEA